MNKKKTLSFAYLSILTILAYIPVIVAVVYSFNASKISSVWGGFSLEWYKEVFADKSLGSAVINSIVLGAVSSILSSVIVCGAVLAFRNKNSRFDRFIKRVSMVPMMIPEVIFAMAYLAFFTLLKLPFGMLTLVIAHMSFCIPYTYLQLESRVALMDDAPTEAARVMGAGPIRAFCDVTLPFLMPAVTSGLFLSFAMSFDDVVLSMFVTGVNTNTLALKIYSQVKTNLTPKVNAVCTLMLLCTCICMIISAALSKVNRKKIVTEEKND